MRTRRGFLRTLALVVASPFLAEPAAAEPAVKAIATFSILGDMVREVGGERVQVTTLVGPDDDAHVYQPTPADARAVADARIVFVNGLAFEGWIDRLIRSAGFKGQVVVVSKGIEPLTTAQGEARARGIIDPHAWQSLKNGAIYVRNVANGLSAADPASAAAYRENAERYLNEIDALDREVRAALDSLAPNRRRIVTSHDAFGYFAAAYHLEMLAPEGVSTESEPSAKDVARLILQIRAEAIPAVFMENVTDPRLIEQIRRETGAAIGGTLYSDALSEAQGPASTYLKMFQHNLNMLTKALSA